MPYSALNGRLPDSMLVHLDWPEEASERLRPDAAASIDLLAVAFHAAFGVPLRITDSYRSIAQQVAVKAAKGKLAATPGTSNHGLGIALDMASGINSDGSTAHKWFEQNAPRYGWVNPAWAVDYNPANGAHEPWHWEYHPELDQHPSPAPAPAPTPRPIHVIIEESPMQRQVIHNSATNTFAVIGPIGSKVRYTIPNQKIADVAIKLYGPAIEFPARFDFDLAFELPVLGVV